MGLLSKLERASAERKAYEIVDTTSPKLGAYFGGSTVTGKTVNDNTVMQITAFFACVRLLAETMGAMPSAFFRREKSGNAEKVDHPLGEILIDRPNLDMNDVEYRECSTTNITARGNGYSLIERRGDGNVSSLYPIPSVRCTPRRDSRSNWNLVYDVQDRGKTETYPADKIWHRKQFSWDGITGMSPIQCARETFALALAGQEFNARLFAQGLMPSARVSMPQWLTTEQRELANKKLLEMHAGLVNMGKPMLLEGGMKVESGLITPEEAQFLGLRQFSVVEICRLLAVKPHMVAALERATDNNIERLGLEFVMYTMLPHIRRDETAVRKLLKPADRERFFYRYNFDGLLRADSTARSQLYSILLQNGVYSRNEVRALENRNKVTDAGMDDYTVQSNMAMIDQLAALVAARSAGKDTSAAEVKIELSTMEDSLAVATKGFESVATGQERMVAAIASLAKSNVGLHDALVRHSNRLDEIGDNISHGVEDLLKIARVSEASVSAEMQAALRGDIKELMRLSKMDREVVYNPDGTVKGARLVDNLT